MALDLSQIIQDGLHTTLNSLLGKPTSLIETTKVHEKDILDIQLLRVDSEFAFEKITTKLSYLIPATSACVIFNTMMGTAEYDMAETIDDDTSDAIGEFVSNLSGGLVTAINAENFEDLGSVKFNIPHKEILNGNDIENITNTFRFVLNIEETQVVLFINFEDNFLEYIKNICESVVTEHDEEINEEETVEEEVVEKPNEEVQEETAKEEEKNPEAKESIEDEEVQKEDPKTKKMKLLIMIIGGLVVLTILSGIVMYFMGVFDPEPIPAPVAESNVTKETKDQVSVVKYHTLKKVDFKITDINTRRLNAKLELLTKYEVLNDTELENQKREEKNRLFNLKKEQELLEFSMKNKEEPLFEKVKDTNISIVDKKTKFTNETFAIKKEKITITNNIKSAEKNDSTQNASQDTVKKEEKVSPMKNSIEKIQESKDTLRYIIANSLKYSLFKNLISKTETKLARISICGDDEGKTVMYIGPFENEIIQDKMESLIKDGKKNIITTKVSITSQEFDTKCSF